MKTKDKSRIRYIKTLQHLAFKNNATITFQYFINDIGNPLWYAEFNNNYQTINGVMPTFTEVVKYLHSKVRTRLVNPNNKGE